MLAEDVDYSPLLGVRQEYGADFPAVYILMLVMINYSVVFSDFFFRVFDVLGQQILQILLLLLLQLLLFDDHFIHPDRQHLSLLESVL